MNAVEEATQTVVLVTQRFNLAIARSDVESIARTLELQVDAVEEKARRLGVELKVTLTGPPKLIHEFHSALGGNGIVAGDPGRWNPLSWLIDELLGAATNSAQSRRRDRARRNPGISDKDR